MTRWPAVLDCRDAGIAPLLELPAPPLWQLRSEPATVTRKIGDTGNKIIYHYMTIQQDHLRQNPS